MLKSELEEDPLFDDDWEASEYLYPRHLPATHNAQSRRATTTTQSKTTTTTTAAYATPNANTTVLVRPPITLLVMAVGPNIIFDPTRQELSVADLVLAVSVTSEVVFFDQDEDEAMGGMSSLSTGAATKEKGARTKRVIKLSSIRTIDPPSGFTAPGVPNALNPAITGNAMTGGTQSTPVTSSSPSQGFSSSASKQQQQQQQARQAMVTEEEDRVEGVWKPKRGGFKREMVMQIIKKVLEPGGVAQEVLDGLEGVDLG